MTEQKEMPDYKAALEALEWLEEHCWVDEPAEEVARSRFKLIRADLAPTSQWQTMESAPRDGQSIIVYDGMVHIAFWSDAVWVEKKKGETGGWCSFLSRSDTCSHFPTNWMPLPAAPPTKDLAAAEGEKS